MKNARSLFAAAALVVAPALALTASPADAKGCIRGALAGGVAGHYVGHGHAIKGAMAGCVAGHYYYKHKAKVAAAQSQQGQPAAAH